MAFGSFLFFALVVIFCQAQDFTVATFSSGNENCGGNAANSSAFIFGTCTFLPAFNSFMMVSNTTNGLFVRVGCDSNCNGCDIAEPATTTSNCYGGCFSGGQCGSLLITTGSPSTPSTVIILPTPTTPQVPVAPPQTVVVIPPITPPVATVPVAQPQAIVVVPATVAEPVTIVAGAQCLQMSLILCLLTSYLLLSH